MNEFIGKLSSLFNFDSKRETFDLIFIKFYKSVRRKLSCTPVFILIFYWNFLVEYKKIQLIDRSNQVKRNIFFFFHLELKDEGTLFVIKKISKRFSIFDFDERSFTINNSKSEFTTIKSNNFKNKRIVFFRLVNRWKMMVKTCLITFLI
jgi:hypothetical protein